MKCPKCSEELKWIKGYEMSTLVGFYSEEGHNHDDNCSYRLYICKNDHTVKIYKQKKCCHPDCDWVGKEECWCHEGKKVKEWPETKLADIDVMEYFKKKRQSPVF